jgi:hypothetical protein
VTELHQQIAANPLAFLDAPFEAGFRLAREPLEECQLLAARDLFQSLRPRARVLDRVAHEQEVEEICELNDLVPLLVPHTLFKSYPTTLIETGRFDRLTLWLSGLTSVDLASFDCAGLTSVDDWIDRLDERTELRVLHTFGTTGKLSLVPRTRSEWINGGRYVGNCFREWHGDGPDLQSHPRPIIQPGHRYGASGAARIGQTLVELFAGGAHNAAFLYPNGRFSADLAILAGRLAGAEARPDGAAVTPAAALLARREEFARAERERPERLRSFFAETAERFAGKDVYLFAVWPVLHDLAEEGLKRGVRGVFGRDSVLHTGGGTKGRSFPDGWKQRIFEFLGFERHYEFYGMTELIPACPRCAEGNYHIPPVLIPFVLDPHSGEPLPRTGRVTGRFAALDLFSRHQWCGVMTGDEVTLSGWDTPCGCGRGGPFLAPRITRYADLGGDDKIECGAAARAHDIALEYLAGAHP